MRAAGLRSKLDELADQPWLIGDPDTSGAVLGPRVRRLTVAAIVLANVVGIAVVICFVAWVLPKPDGVTNAEIYESNLVLTIVYVVAALVVGVVLGRRLVEGGPSGLREWFESDRDPTPAERLAVLRAPLRIMAVQAALWGGGVVCFSVLNATNSGLLALGIGMTVAIGGLTVSATAYLLAELALRPVASRALAFGVTDRRGVPGVAARSLLAWALGTGAAIVGLLVVGIVALTSIAINETTLGITIVVLCAIALVFGALLSALAAYATVHPIASIRGGLARVQAGDFDVRLGVWDSTEVGLLQAGFNDMAAGLRERERIRDLFGRHVGAEVAQQALTREGGELGGEECTVAVLFVDLVGSTALAAEHPPQQVVELLNRFFAEVVAVVERHGGWINKFQGDAALAIFGAPVAIEDAHGSALRAARELCERLRERVAGVEAAIGVASGVAVAGQVGAEQRFEYTVIGDPVNEAARLTELAKGRPEHLLASGETVAAAADGEAEAWEIGENVTLRGRSRPTAVAVPRSP